MSGREAFRWANLTLAFVLELFGSGEGGDHARGLKKGPLLTAVAVPVLFAVSVPSLWGDRDWSGTRG